MTEKVRRLNVFGLAPLLMWLVAISLVDLVLPLFYILLYLLLRDKAQTWEADTGSRVIDLSDWRASNLWYQALASLVIGGAISSLVILFGHLRVPPDFAAQIAVQVVFVAFIETYYLIVILRTVPYGRYMWWLLFGFSHEIVRENWLRGQFPLESFAGFFYAAFFGVLFQLLYEVRFRVRATTARYFGGGTSMGVHLIINVVLVLFTAVWYGFTLFPLTLLPFAGG